MTGGSPFWETTPFAQAHVASFFSGGGRGGLGRRRRVPGRAAGPGRPKGRAAARARDEGGGCGRQATGATRSMGIPGSDLMELLTI